MNYSFTSLDVIISSVAAAFAVLLAGIVAIRDRKSFANKSFITGLLLLSLVEVFGGLSTVNHTSFEILYWQKTRLILLGLAPGVWLLFSLSFAVHDYRGILKKWRYLIGAFFAVPIVIIVLPLPVLDDPPPDLLHYIPLGYSGKIFYAFILICSVVILGNLERTLRASTGRIRWQIKFIIIGTGTICAAWVYSASQALIYSAINLSLSILNPIALLLACCLFAWGIARSSFLDVEVYLSRTAIQYSLTAFLASIYLVVLGLLAFRVQLLDAQQPLPLEALIVLLALAALSMLLLSDRLQERLKRLITRHFKRPIYDYRKAWMELTENTNSLLDANELCTAVARIISKTFSILSVNIWLCDESKTALSLAGSTVFSSQQATDLGRSGDVVAQLLSVFENDISLIDLKQEMFDWADDIMRAKPEYFAEFKMRTILPLRTGRQLVGIITLNDDRVGKAPLSLEDQDLLNAYASQLAARVLQLRLSENLRQAQEIEAFQNVSAFFVHDLKNLASRLSLTMQNLPVHFDNPEFRGDALKLIQESAAKIDTTISRLSSLKQIEIKPSKTDLNAVLESTLRDFENSTACHVNRNLEQLPLISIDSEQIQRVIVNLMMNAHEATKGKGSIQVTTSTKDHQVILAVTDNGCGMSRQYVDKMLFKPFSSTKKRGMGIGLFHSKMIVEAHHGRIEVESEEGKGTTFRVILPKKQEIEQLLHELHQ
jgi:putative PEP-CTERM system histidine kinase